MYGNHFQIRDPIHGVLFISLQERAVIDSFAFQRLRYIKQVGFADFAFPCATHSRYSHSLGVMHVASKIFDRVIKDGDVPMPDRIKMRQAVRLAALLHDIGHPPLSHTTEMFMPLHPQGPESDAHVRFTHEDFTQKIILDSPLTHILEENFQDVGVSPTLISHLIAKTDDSESFHVNGVNFLPVLKQIISSEIDADRMDYLLRDSFFCGVNYGKFDSDWLIENLIGVEQNSHVYLGFKERALFAFEDFLLSRYHMFLSVYLHHTPVIMEKMLARFFEECPDAFVLPSDVNAYLELNDLDLWQVLRKSNNTWAQRIVRRNPYIMLEEKLGLNDNLASAIMHEAQIKMLKDEKIDTIASRSKSVLSTYWGKTKNPLLVENTQKKAVPLEDYSPVFIRYQNPVELFRIFIDAKDRAKAEEIFK